MLLIIAVLCGIGQPGDGIMARVYRRQAEIARAHGDATYTAVYVYREHDPDGRLLCEETCRRRVFVKGERQRVEFLEVTANGRVLEGDERERKIRELRRKGLVQDRTRMPFRADTRDEYRYRVAGDTTLGGRPAWLIEFEPARRTGRHIVGRAWVFSDAVNDVGRMEFRPDRLPVVVPEMRMVLEYAPDGMTMLPDRFDLDMRVHVKLLVTLFERRITIEDRFGDYRFNTGLPDSLFK